MKDRSHKDEMRAALRGDFDRMRARQKRRARRVPPPSEARDTGERIVLTPARRPTEPDDS